MQESGCFACGAPVADDARFCTACGAPLTVTCPGCGRAAERSHRFCAECGRSLEPGPAASGPSPAPRSEG